MMFQFPSTVERSNLSDSNQSISRVYHYERSSTLQPSTTSHSPNNRDSSSSFGSETAVPPRRPKSPPPPVVSRESPPKSPKRFWAFSAQTSTPVPPLPAMPSHIRSSSTNSIGLGTGAEIIRRPSEAARTMKQRSERKHDRGSRKSGPGLMALTDMEILGKEFDTMMQEPTTAPLPSGNYGQGELPRMLPSTAPLRTKSSRTSLKSVKANRQEETDKRATIKPPPRTLLPPVPFSYHLLSHTSRPASASGSTTIITLDFAYSTEKACSNTSVKLTWEILKRGGGHLVDTIEKVLNVRPQKGRAGLESRGSLESEKSDPDLTDGESSEDSELGSAEYGINLEALLRDEYLKSLMLPDSPDVLKHFPPPPPLPENFSITVPSSNKPRAQKRNQYAQQDKFPSPSSPYTARSHTLPLLLAPARPRSTIHSLKISTSAAAQPSAEAMPHLKQSGTITEINILLLRDSMPYHLIAQRLIAGSFVNTSLSANGDPVIRKKLEEELRWLGMTRLAEELGDSQYRTGQGPVPRHKKSGVITGGQGYI